MSTFSGRLREYPFVSLDRFDGINLQSTCYFLSHNHADHTQGLDQQSFQYRLTSNCNYKLYCSVVTKALLLLDARYKHLSKNIIGVETNQPQQITIYDPDTGKVKEDVTVTLLRAEHCPGSVMFLFEGAQGNVLYTGDFRLNRSDLASMEHLHHGDRVKEISSLYLDTTFCVPQALFIPSREQSNQAAIDVVQEWIGQSKNHVVCIKHKAALGYEDLFRALCLHFNMKVHVSEYKYEQYKRVGDMAEYTTPDPSQTQIHACQWQVDRDPSSPLPCGHLPKDGAEFHLRQIKVSTMFFLQRVSLETFAKRFNEKFFRICYSFHSSYSEIRDMVLYLRPQRALPNVIPIEETLEKIQSRLNRFVETAKSCTIQSSPHTYKALGKLKVRKRKRQLKLSQKSNDSAYMFGDLGDSPIKPKRIRGSVKKDDGTGVADSVEFPTLHGSVDSEDEGAELSQDSGKNLAGNGEEDIEGQYSSADEKHLSEGDLFSSDEETEMPLSQEDKKCLENFTPIQQDSYGSYLGYCSDPDEDDSENTIDGLGNSQTDPPTKQQLNECVNGRSSSGEETVNKPCHSPKSLIEATKDSDKPNTDNAATSDSAKNRSEAVSQAQNHTMTNSLSFGSSVEIMDSCDAVRSKLDDASRRAMMEGVEALEMLKSQSVEIEAPRSSDRATAADSTDVIILGEGDDSDSDLDDEEEASDIEQDSDETTDPDHVMPGDDNTSGSTGSNQQTHGKSRTRLRNAGSTNGHGRPASGEGNVIASIDLTGADEEDDVQPSTSQDPSQMFGGYTIADNIFMRLQAQVYNSPLDGDKDGEVELYAKEVPCSDDECECGGKSKGGTHKYMVPRKKTPTLPAVNIDWKQISQTTTEEDSLESSEVRTRKWIENQVMFTQRRNFLNSQAVANNDIIVINSESESDDEEEEADVGAHEPEASADTQLQEPAGENSTVTMSAQPASSPELPTQPQPSTSAAQEPSTSSQTPPPIAEVKDANKHAIKRGVSPKQQASPASDRSATVTSCPTNLSMLVQPSETSVKNAVVECGLGSKVINGSRSDLTELNEASTSKVPSETTGDRETGSS